jgi:hypothetical protein
MRKSRPRISKRGRLTDQAITGFFRDGSKQPKKGVSWHQRNAQKHFLAADNQFPQCESFTSGQTISPEEKSSNKKEDKPGRADKYCYRICHHGKARQIEATKSKKRGNTKKATELQFWEARKCHHRKTSEDFCV